MHMPVMEFSNVLSRSPPFTSPSKSDVLNQKINWFDPLNLPHWNIWNEVAFNQSDFWFFFLTVAFFYSISLVCLIGCVCVASDSDTFVNCFPFTWLLLFIKFFIHLHATLFTPPLPFSLRMLSLHLVTNVSISNTHSHPYFTLSLSLSLFHFLFLSGLPVYRFWHIFLW